MKARDGGSQEASLWANSKGKLSALKENFPAVNMVMKDKLNQDASSTHQGETFAPVSSTDREKIDQTSTETLH